LGVARCGLSLTPPVMCEHVVGGIRQLPCPLSFFISGAFQLLALVLVLAQVQVLLLLLLLFLLLLLGNLEANNFGPHRKYSTFLPGPTIPTTTNHHGFAPKERFRCVRGYFSQALPSRGAGRCPPQEAELFRCSWRLVHAERHHRWQPRDGAQGIDSLEMQQGLCALYCYTALLALLFTAPPCHPHPAIGPKQRGGISDQAAQSSPVPWERLRELGRRDHLWRSNIRSSLRGCLHVECRGL